jgi:hypothetical protein
LIRRDYCVGTPKRQLSTILRDYYSELLRGVNQAIIFNPSKPRSYPLTTSGEIGGLRKFDELARVEDTAQALLQFDPTYRLSFSASYDTRTSIAKPYGLPDKDII